MPLAVRALRRVMNLLALLLLGYLAVLLLIFLIQGRLLFLPDVPGRTLETLPAEHSMPFEEVHLVADDGERLHGWWVPAPEGLEGPPPKTVLLFHGNAGNISHRIDTLKIWHEMGWNAFIFDYRGYSLSTGRPSEAGTYRDARAAWRHLTEERGVSPRDIVLFGRSLGGAVAARLATEVEPMALILESTFTSVPDLGAEIYRWLPVRLLSRIHYPTLVTMTEVRAPVLVIHSPTDEIIPVHHGRALYEAANPPKQFLELVGGHNDGFISMGNAYQRVLVEFVERTEREGSGN
ncbi:MAG TPA: alpha/beta hydrolase [Longimicrobiaceae bacterium]|nr:alpha/beta hydrolase [Longimicrobiaceae bacterium]